MSIWSEANKLANHNTHYWDGKDQKLVSIIRVDGHPYRIMGNDPAGIPAMHQKSVQVLPTRTIYQFKNSKILLTLTFMTPRLPAHLKYMTQPVTYITWQVRSADGSPHKVQLYYSTSTRVAVNTSKQKVKWWRKTMGPLTALQAGHPTQNYFDIAGDPVGLDWGYVYTAANTKQAAGVVALNRTCVHAFTSTGKVPNNNATGMPRSIANGNPVEAFSFNLGSVGSTPVSRHVMVAYDEVYAINFFGEYTRPYWRKGGVTPAKMLEKAATRYKKLTKDCIAFDTKVMADARRVGGRRYAVIAALAYRQALAAMGISADRNGAPMVFTKEETSNGDIATVDVFFPASPIWLLFDPQMEAASMEPVLDSAETKRWKFPWAPHDLGTYPICTGHYNSGGENMQVEESGNMIILADAIARAEGNAKFATKYWPMLTSWVQYLRRAGFDPKKQLSTNDFLGFMAHNANLSIKAILAMGAYGSLCKMRGMNGEARSYQSLARRWARKWMRVDNNGSHYRMAFNQPGTWSQDYNLVWDQVLHLHAFPMAVRRKQMAFYMTQLHKYGLPDRSTVTQTKTDFSIWTATMATRPSQFHAIINRIYKFLDQTSTRVPFADQYGTRKGWGGMHARPVMGAAFMPMMNNAKIWHYWASRGAKFPDNWAGLPPPPVITSVVPTAQRRPVMWRYTINRPGAGWYKRGFDASGWKRGPAGFGSADPGVRPRTRWRTDNIWMRRHFRLSAAKLRHLNLKDLRIYAYHDEDIKVYINGVYAGGASGYSTSYVPLEMTRASEKALHAGENLMAITVHQTTGGQFADAGLVEWHIPRRRHRAGGH